jgi:hypothetical protein
MRLWVSGSGVAGNIPETAQRLPSGPKARPRRRELCRGLSPGLLKNHVRSNYAALLVALVCGVAGAQVVQQKATVAKKTTVHKANELTLAGLRPGTDTFVRAKQVTLGWGNGRSSGDALTEWFDPCRDVSLSIEVDKDKRIQIIRTASWSGSTADCSKMLPGRWKTGLGLRVDDLPAKVAQLYGEPDSKSPSSKGGQQLELWYYAFDWAGPDVPQVMEVLCTVNEGGKPGRVVEITLAAPSL